MSASPEQPASLLGTDIVPGSVSVPRGGSAFRRFLAFLGPGAMVSVGYIDPGNWATSLEGGSRFGYTLLCVILLSNLMAVLLQSLCARLGIASGRDLAQSCREHYSKPVSVCLWVMCELAIIATDLAEVIGTAVALKLLFGIPLGLGAAITIVDTVVLLMLMRRGFRWLEAFVMSLMALIFTCFVVELALAQPSLAGIVDGFLTPDASIVTNPQMLYIAIGIIGATVMPHNLYLHSALVKTRDFEQSVRGKREALRFATLDSTLSLSLALFVNAGILILAAAVFHSAGRTVVEIEDAYALLSPLLGAGIAATLFGVALLASGLNSTVTATLAGQIVMEGFLRVRMKPWIRRLVTRGLAILPVLYVTQVYGDQSVGRLLILSQVVLSLQLPFAIIPLIRFVSRRDWMGELTIGWKIKTLTWAITILILVLNARLVMEVFHGL
ncbi:Nramp family divalent metal transporter [Kushneria phyllosphaerae]|uniref:Divalent metal cation transporter MntH n=1 Tax=Kushneria phyllosphaerae TaxID=2100822 RepID=A0A2R8CJT1_9GAMM|nr:Nramp family divalent metal transporter [Kushneria phyllosphaerae]SPJ33082.1 Divalent metal cation transporter MntH [Kushneria phyllosphaerae]